MNPLPTRTAAHCNLFLVPNFCFCPWPTLPQKTDFPPQAHADMAPRHFEFAGIGTIQTFRPFLLLSPRLPPNHRKTSMFWLHSTVSTECLPELPAVIYLGANIKFIFCMCTHGHKPLTSNEEETFHTNHSTENLCLLWIKISINNWKAMFSLYPNLCVCFYDVKTQSISKYCYIP